MKQLTIILPVYNVAPYIRACLDSIFRQGLDDGCFEVILVNDGSTDDSLEVIADIVAQKSNITVVEQANQGLSVARNKGIAMARGEYILMVDPDDMLVDDALPTLLNTALETKADLVVADFVEMADGEMSAHQDIAQQGFIMAIKTGERLLLEDLNPHECYSWRTLYRRMFLLDHRISFHPGVVYQDVPFTHECYLKAKRCVRTPWLLNVYRRGRAGAATTTFSMKKARDFCVVIAKTWELGKLDNLSGEVRRKLEADVYTSFYSLVYSSIYAFKDKAAVVDILKRLRRLAPDLRFTQGVKQRAVTFLFRHMPRLYVGLLTAKSI